MNKKVFNGTPHVINVVQGFTDRFGGEGHQVSDTNMVIGADEFIMNAETTKAQESFLRKLNSGKYDRVNIESLIEKFGKQLAALWHFQALLCFRSSILER